MRTNDSDFLNMYDKACEQKEDLETRTKSVLHALKELAPASHTGFMNEHKELENIKTATEALKLLSQSLSDYANRVMDIAKARRGY